MWTLLNDLESQKSKDMLPYPFHRILCRRQGNPGCLLGIFQRRHLELAHPETYTGGSDLKEFEVFIAGILRWLKMNSLLGPTSTSMQVGYLGTRLTGKAQEWFYRNVE